MWNIRHLGNQFESVSEKWQGNRLGINREATVQVVSAEPGIWMLVVKELQASSLVWGFQTGWYGLDRAWQAPLSNSHMRRRRLVMGKSLLPVVHVVNSWYWLTDWWISQMEIILSCLPMPKSYFGKQMELSRKPLFVKNYANIKISNIKIT